MNEEIITLDLLIKHFETECFEKYGSLKLAEQLKVIRFPKAGKNSWGYFESLKAAINSDGSLESSNRQLTECLRRYAQNKRPDTRQQDHGRQDG